MTGYAPSLTAKAGDIFGILDIFYGVLQGRKGMKLMEVASARLLSIAWLIFVLF